MNERTFINGKQPLGIYCNGKPILAIMVNGTRIWPVDTPIEEIDLTAILSCFGMGMWVDDLPWNDKAIWSE